VQLWPRPECQVSLGFFGGDILEVFWPDVSTTMTATADARINNWLHGADIIPTLVGGTPLC
jgi:hypothetical protein